MLSHDIVDFNLLQTLSIDLQTVDDGVGMHGQQLVLLLISAIVEEVNVESKVLAIFVNVSDLEAGFRDAVSQIWMGIGVEAK